MQEPVPPPAWDAADPSASLLRHAAWLNTEARRSFQEAGTHVELVFLLRADGEGGLATPPPGMARPVFTAALRDAIKSHDLYGIIHVAEAWTYLPGRPGDHTFRQLAEGEMTVHDLKSEDRTEALMVHLQSRDGLQLLWIHPITRTASSITLGDPREISEPIQGCLSRLFDR